MIDLKDLRDNPDKYKDGARAKGVAVDIDRLLELDTQHRALLAEQESQRATQKKLSKEIGPQIGTLRKQLKTVPETHSSEIESQIRELEEKPLQLKNRIAELDEQIAAIKPKLETILLAIPQPPDPDVPPGTSEADNVQLRTWHPNWFNPSKSFVDNKGFAPRTHMQLAEMHNLVDFERGVKMSGSRSYILTGDGARLHQAILRLAFDFITTEHGFVGCTVPVIVREEMMVGTGFFPAGHDQAYHIEESKRGSGHDLFLTGTGEVSLMAMHADEILSADQLPLQYATVSTCFRREAGAAGKDTAGLYRIHQFDKVEQVVICKADETESRQWHQKMIGIVEALLQKLEFPYRLLQCCTGDLGPKNADMIDIESWMPSRGDVDADGNPAGAWGETHSASRLYDYQCRRLNLRYRNDQGKTVFCHSLNNTVLASPRVLIPLLELYQNEDGSITIPKALQPYMNNQQRIG